MKSTTMRPRLTAGGLIIGLVAAALTTTVPQASAAAPSNDNFASASVIGPNLPISVTGSNIDATLEAAEPNHGDTTNNGASVWYRWTAPVSGAVTIDVTSPLVYDEVEEAEVNAWDPLMSVYTGTSLTGLETVAANDDAGPNTLNPRVVFDTQAGVTYSIAVGGYAVPAVDENDGFYLDPSTGPFTLSMTGPATPPPATGPGSQACATAKAGNNQALAAQKKATTQVKKAKAKVKKSSSTAKKAKAKKQLKKAKKSLKAAKRAVRSTQVGVAKVC